MLVQIKITDYFQTLLDSKNMRISRYMDLQEQSVHGILKSLCVNHLVQTAVKDWACDWRIVSSGQSDWLMQETEKEHVNVETFGLKQQKPRSHVCLLSFVST